MLSRAWSEATWKAVLSPLLMSSVQRCGWCVRPESSSSGSTGTWAPPQPLVGLAGEGALLILGLLRGLGEKNRAWLLLRSRGAGKEVICAGAPGRLGSHPPPACNRNRPNTAQRASPLPSSAAACPAGPSSGVTSSGKPSLLQVLRAPYCSRWLELSHY